jgi:hypothetical protein
MHHQRDLGMLHAPWVLGAWSGGAYVGSAGGLLILAHLGRNMASGAHGTAGVEEQAEKGSSNE